MAPEGPGGNVFDFAAERAWREARKESGIIFDDAPPIDIPAASEESPVSHEDLLDAGVIDDSEDPLIDFGSRSEETPDASQNVVRLFPPPTT